MTFEEVRRLALALPGVVEGTSYGTPGFRVRKRFFLRLREGNESIALNQVNDEERAALFASAPRTFFTTPHYDGYPIVLVRFATVRPGQLAALFERSWRRLAPKRLVEAHDSGRLDLGTEPRGVKRVQRLKPKAAAPRPTAKRTGHGVGRMKSEGSAPGRQGGRGA